MNSRFFRYLGALAALFTTSLGLAQEPRNLTETDVVTAAVTSNPTLHVALLRAQQSGYNLRAEEALYTPVFDANLGYTHSRTPSLVGPTFDAMGMRLAPAGTRIGGSDVVDIGAGITKPFAYGTLLSASVAGQRSSRASLEQQALLGASGVVVWLAKRAIHICSVVVHSVVQLIVVSTVVVVVVVAPL